jgi:hypothetical protein
VEYLDQAAFGKSVLQTIYDLGEIQVPTAQALESVLAEIKDLIDLNDPKVLDSRHSYFQIPNTISADYKERFFEVRPGGFALLGIRHVNGEKDQPFVHALLGFDPSDTDLPLIRNIAFTNFKAFSPKHVSFWLRPSAGLAQKLEKKGLAARRYVVGNIMSLSRTAVPAGYERIRLEEMKNASDLKWYERAYAAFHEEQPEMASWVPITECEDLQQCAEDGLLYKVLVDEDRAGLIAGRREALLGLSGIYMAELLLLPPYKGKGLAPALQRKFLGQLDSGIELVWGTIDARNTPSTRTALKMGRKAIRTEFFLPLLNE